MAERGLCSRREADELIAKGWVKVDGQVISELGSKVERSVEIELHPQAQKDLKSLATILINKPIGYVSGQPEPGSNYPPAVRLVTPETQYIDPSSRKPTGSTNRRLEDQHFSGLAPAGRLDIDSQGLLVLTQDGVVAKQLIGENSDVEKEYMVRVQGELSKDDLKLLNHGLSIDGVPLKRAKVEWINEDQLRFVLKEGKKRQIRKMCEAVNLKVVGLKRVRIGGVMLGRLPEGMWRFLEDGESF